MPNKLTSPLFLFIIPLLLSPLACHSTTVADYFPLKKGLQLFYHLNAVQLKKNQPAQSLTAKCKWEVVREIEPNVFEIKETITGGIQSTQTFHLSHLEGELYLKIFPKKRGVPLERTLLSSILEKDTTWQDEWKQFELNYNFGKIGQLTLQDNVLIQAKNLGIQPTRVGRIGYRDTLKIQYTFLQPSTKKIIFTQYLWFRPKMGIVKNIIRSPQLTIIRNLQRIQQPKEEEKKL